MKRRFGLEPDDEVWDIIVCLAVVKVGDRESEAGILHESIHMLVRVDEVRSRFLPRLRVGDDVVDVAVYDFAHFATCPEVNVHGRTRTATCFVNAHDRSLALRDVRLNRVSKMVDYPSVIGGTEPIYNLGWLQWPNFLTEI